MSFKVYFYTDEQVGIPWLGPDADRDRHGEFPEPRFYWCAFPSFEPTENPDEADVFVVRQRLVNLPEEKVYELGRMCGVEERVIFFDVIETFQTYPELDCTFIRCNTTRQMVEVNPNTVSWPWPTEDFGTYMSTPCGGYQYDVGFQGQANDMARTAMESIRDAGLSHQFRINDRFWPHICDGDENQGKMLRRTFLENMQGGRLSLCPMSLDGVIRYRFYEAMSMARVNVLLCDRCALPMPDKIDWDKCVIFIPEQFAPIAGELLKVWLHDHTDEEIWEMGLYARKMWKKWLWRGRWAEMVDMVVRERLDI